MSTPPTTTQSLAQTAGSPPDSQTLSKLEATARQCRIDILTMLEKARSGHPGGSLSCIDIIVTLFGHEMRWDPKNPHWEERDRFVLSKGHGAPAFYAALAYYGAIPKEELSTLRQINSRIQGHPDRVALPFAEASTGSLGQGISIAQGLALGMKMKKLPARVYCVLGDGETQEGQVWETAMSAAKFKLNNLVCFLDNNNGQIDGHVDEVMDLRPIADKWRSFRWNVLEINGHDFKAITGALQKAKEEKERPTLIWAHTVKGKGVSFMENNIKWHGVAPSKEELARALSELQK